MKLTQPIKIIRVRGFSKEYDFRSPVVVRIYRTLLEELGGRNAWVKISNGKRSIYRLAKGSGNVKGFCAKDIEIDYDSQRELEIDGTKFDADGWLHTNLELSRCSKLGEFISHWTHPEMGYRIPIQLSLISLVLGFIGLILGVVSFFKK